MNRPDVKIGDTIETKDGKGTVHSFGYSGELDLIYVILSDGGSNWYKWYNGRWEVW